MCTSLTLNLLAIFLTAPSIAFKFPFTQEFPFKQRLKQLGIVDGDSSSETAIVKGLSKSFFGELENSFRKLGADHGLNKVVKELNEGTFKTIPLDGRLKKIILEPTTLSEMSFNSFPELSLGPLELLDDGAYVFKGDTAPFESAHDNLYAVQSPFKILEPKPVPGLNWIPTAGSATIVGSFVAINNDSELRISLERAELTLTTSGDGGMLSHRFTPRHFKAPHLGTHEVLLMTAELTAVKGNLGSLFLLIPLRK